MNARELLDAVVVELAYAERVLDETHVASSVQVPGGPHLPRLWKGWNGEILAYEGLGRLKVRVAPLQHLLDGDERERASEALAEASPLFFAQRGNIVLALSSTCFVASAMTLAERRALSLDTLESDLGATPEKCVQARTFDSFGWMPWQWERFVARGIPPEFAGQIPAERRFRAAQDVIARWNAERAA